MAECLSLIKTIDFVYCVINPINAINSNLTKYKNDSVYKTNIYL